MEQMIKVSIGLNTSLDGKCEHCPLYYEKYAYCWAFQKNIPERFENQFWWHFRLTECLAAEIKD
jgi:hypothetical protein